MPQNAARPCPGAGSRQGRCPELINRCAKACNVLLGRPRATQRQAGAAKCQHTRARCISPWGLPPRRGGIVLPCFKAESHLQLHANFSGFAGRGVRKYSRWKFF